MSICTHSTSNCFDCHWKTDNCVTCNEYSLIVKDGSCFNCYYNSMKSICNTCGRAKTTICVNCEVKDVCSKCGKNSKSLNDLCYDCLIIFE